MDLVLQLLSVKTTQTRRVLQLLSMETIKMDLVFLLSRAETTQTHRVLQLLSAESPKMDRVLGSSIV